MQLLTINLGEIATDVCGKQPKRYGWKIMSKFTQAYKICEHETMANNQRPCLNIEDWPLTGCLGSLYTKCSLSNVREIQIPQPVIHTIHTVLENLKKKMSTQLPYLTTISSPFKY